MNDIFINLTNHPSARWSKEERDAAEKFGKIIDIPFPNIPALLSEDDVRICAKKVAHDVLDYHPKIVLCQGEFTCCFSIIKILMNEGITVVSACSERQVIDELQQDGSTVKKSIFKFVQFRAYETI